MGNEVLRTPYTSRFFGSADLEKHHKPRQTNHLTQPKSSKQATSPTYSEHPKGNR
jgi:hypothetical protein